MVDVLTSDAARRNMLRHATGITLFMRHGANFLVSTVVVALPPAAHAPAARVCTAALGAWSAYRLLTRSTGTRPLTVDYLCTIAVCLATPILVSGPHFYLANSAPVAIAGTAVISFTIATPPRVSLALSAGVAAAFAIGAARAVGWNHVGDIFNLYYFALQWVTASLIRMMVLRVADSVDTSRTERVALELQQEITATVREFDREQMRLLHDTVASTLLTVSDGTTLAPEQLAAHARRDLQVFAHTTWEPRQARTDLVAALRRNAEYTTTPVTYTGLATLWLDGSIAATVAAAAREALTNVDRHAGASTVTITVETSALRITDNGRGFDATAPTSRHGIARSITDRMRGIGGDAIITSRPGAGTTVELQWPTVAPSTAPPPDPERLIERTRTGYGLALTAYAIANLAAMVPAALSPTSRPHLQWALAGAAAAATLSAIPRSLHTTGLTRRLGAATLLLVALVQTVTLPVDQLGTQTQWSQGAIGWCILPLVLHERVRTAIAILVSCWSIPALYALIQDPSAHTIVNLGYGTASILTVQLCALGFDNLIRRAADTAAAETQARARLVAADRTADAIQAEYQRRYADLADTIGPLLTGIVAAGGTITATTQQSAQVEYQKLRALFDHTFDHVLLRELQPIIDAAQDRGVAVAVTVAGTLPAIEHTTADSLAHAIAPALAAATVSARITATGEASSVRLGAICHGVAHPENFAQPTNNSENHVDLIILDDAVWITVRHQLPTGGP